MKNTILLLAVLITAKLSAQSYQIEGRVTTSTENLVSVAITAYEIETDSLLAFTYSDEVGAYSLSVSLPLFRLEAEYLGFVDHITEIDMMGASVLLHDIAMLDDKVILDQVEIKAKKQSFIEMKGDKMIIEVAESGIGEGNDGLETMARLPGIRLDRNENLVFRGSSSLQIMIDGKPSVLQGEALTQFLKTISGTNIKAVEIIANPSARYDAKGSAGILNIKLKKSIYSGFTGNAFASVGYAEYIKNSYGVNLYNNTEKWNLNARASYSYNESVNHRRVIRTFDDGTTSNSLTQLNDWLPVSNSFSTALGASYQISSTQSIGSSWNFRRYLGDALTLGSAQELRDGIEAEYSTLREEEVDNDANLTGNIYYNFTSEDENTTLDVQANFGSYSNENHQITANRFFEQKNGSVVRIPQIVSTNNPTDIRVFNMRADYFRQLDDLFSVEMGGKYSDVSNNYLIEIKDQDEAGRFVLNDRRSNELLYDESIIAGYAIANADWKKWNLQGGLRAEYINFTANSITTSEVNADDYLSFFPSFSINNTQENHQYKFSYSRRIDRPRYIDLNPFFDYIDTYNVEVGNPRLRPTFTNAFEATWVYKGQQSISAYANFEDESTLDVMLYDPETKVTTSYVDNIASSTSIGTSISLNASPKSWWNLQFYGDASYERVQSDLAEVSFDRSGSGWYASIDQTFKLPKDWTLTWNSFYRSRSRSGISVYLPSYDMSFGMRKYFLDKKLAVRFRAYSVFKTNQWRSITVQNNVTTQWRNRWETRRFSLSVIYNFGEGKKKRVKGTDVNDERSRM